MGKSKSIRVGTKQFLNLEEAKSYVREIVARWDVGQRVLGDDEIFIHDLILLHPEAERKIGVGVEYFTLQLNKTYRRNKEFKLVRFDQSSTEFSWRDCIHGNCHQRDVKKALRFAVSGQVIAFKVSMFNSGTKIKCPISFRTLTESTCQVDHVPPQTFMNMVSEWLVLKQLTFEEVCLVESADNQDTCRLADAKLQLDWQEFHRLNAKLRLLDSSENLSRKANKISISEGSDLFR